MTLHEFRDKVDRFWASADREAREQKDSYLALDRLHSVYRRLDAGERELADQVLAEWLLSDDEARRFDAIALIREFGIVAAVPNLRRLSKKLMQNKDPGAPFEREKVEDLLAELSR
jgi:hypothetical protein